MIRDDDFQGFMLDRIGGTPTAWMCVWCHRNAATIQEIEHPERCPIARLQRAEQRAAAWQDVADDLTERLSASEQRAAALQKENERLSRCAEADRTTIEALHRDVKFFRERHLAASGGAAPAEQAGGK